MMGKIRGFRSIRILLTIYIILLPVMFILPFFSADGYLMLQNTTSQLGAQHTPNAWFMNIIFILLGIATILEGWFQLKNYWVQQILLFIFGISLIFTAIYQHAPITEDITYSLYEDKLHSLFASIVGYSFTFFAVSAAFIERTNGMRLLAVLTASITTGFSILMFTVSDFAGLWQRLIFIVAFAWLIFFFEKRRKSF